MESLTLAEKKTVLQVILNAARENILGFLMQQIVDKLIHEIERDSQPPKT